MTVRWTLLLAAAMVAVASSATPAQTVDAPTDVPATDVAAVDVAAVDPASGGIDNPLRLPDLTGMVPSAETPGQMSSALQIVLMMTVLSLAPSILIMMTCFTRIIVVLGLLRQAMATQQLPPNQVLICLALFMTFVVMAPVYGRIHEEAIQPYLDGEITQAGALAGATVHMRGFMIDQIEAGDNSDDVYLFLDEATADKPELMWGDVPTMTLIPAFVVSELKIAFLMGFRVYLPFLVIDMVIASVLISMGMLMLPPVLISLPFKLLLFVLVDGWHLVVRTLMVSFG